MTALLAPSLTITPFGDRAFIVSANDAGHAQALYMQIRQALGHLVSTVIPTSRAVTVCAASGASPNHILSALRDLPPTPSNVSSSGRVISIPVTYDGPDLDTVSQITGLSVPDIILRHTAARYTVLMLGFSPGFPYLSGGDKALTVPRLSTPRTHVPAGSVGLSGENSCVYPTVSPGGWQLIGSTTMSLFDATLECPAALSPGDVVRFVVAS